MTKTAEQIINLNSYYTNHIYFTRGWQDRMSGYEYFNPHTVEDHEIAHLPHYARIALQDYACGWNTASAKITERRNATAAAATFISDYV
jgi:hypothetical protein